MDSLSKHHVHTEDSRSGKGTRTLRWLTARDNRVRGGKRSPA